MNKSADLAIRYGIALARNEAAQWYYVWKTTGESHIHWSATESRLRGVVRFRYRRLALEALHRTRRKEFAKFSVKARDAARKMLG